MRAVNHGLIIGEWMQLLDWKLAPAYHAAAELEEEQGLVTYIGHSRIERVTRSRVYLRYLTLGKMQASFTCIGRYAP